MKDQFINFNQDESYHLVTLEDDTFKGHLCLKFNEKNESKCIHVYIMYVLHTYIYTCIHTCIQTYIRVHTNSDYVASL